jgi:hypothetical protein
MEKERFIDAQVGGNRSADGVIVFVVKRLDGP